MAGIIVDNNVLNQANTPVLLADVIGNLPAPGLIGRIFISIDTYIFLRDYGSFWLQIGGTGGGGGGFIPYTGANQGIDLGYNSFMVNGIVITNQEYLYNVGIGSEILVLNTSGAYNVAIGSFAMLSNTNGSNNVAIGYSVLENNSTGNSNICIGNTAGNTLLTGDNNIFIGFYAGISISNGSDNVFIGNFQNSAPDTSSNILIGTDAKGILLANFNTGYWETPDSIQQTVDNTSIKNFLQSELTLGTGQTVLPSAPVTIDTAIKLTINGVDYWLQASTTAPVNTANVVMENNTGNTLIPFTALLNATNVVGLTAVSLGTGLTTGTTTAFVIGSNTIVLSNATMPFSVNNVQDDVTSGSLAFITSAQPALTVTITLPTITAPIIADGIRISIA